MYSMSEVAIFLCANDQKFLFVTTTTTTATAAVVMSYDPNYDDHSWQDDPSHWKYRECQRRLREMEEHRQQLKGEPPVYERPYYQKDPDEWKRRNNISTGEGITFTVDKCILF